MGVLGEPVSRCRLEQETEVRLHSDEPRVGHDAQLVLDPAYQLK